jgi:hypothetical protein
MTMEARRAAIVHRAGSGELLRLIANDFGISPQRVSQIFSKFLGTPADNVHDAQAKGRRPKGRQGDGQAM